MISDNRIINGTGFVLLNGGISMKNSAMIAQELYDIKAKGIHPVLKINSGGGSVLGGYNIVDAVKTTGADTHIIGIAASMAGIIAQFGAKRMANDHAIAMIHPPTGTGDIIEMVRAGLQTALKGRSKFSEDEVLALFEDGAKDEFYNAESMEKFGLIDEIIPTHEKAIEIGNKTKTELFEIYNNLINTEKMDLDVQNELKSLREENAKISGLEADNKAQKEELEAVKAENVTLCEQVKAEQKIKAETLIKNAIESGKLKEADSEKWTDNAVNNFELVSDMLSEITVDNSMVVEDLLNVDNKKKTLKEMSQVERAELAKNQPEVYNNLILKED